MPNLDIPRSTVPAQFLADHDAYVNEHINDLNSGTKTRAGAPRDSGTPAGHQRAVQRGMGRETLLPVPTEWPDANGFNAWLNLRNSTGNYGGIIQ